MSQNPDTLRIVTSPLRESRSTTPYRAMTPMTRSLYGLATPSSSPMRMRQLHNDGKLNIESTVYKSAMEKIDEASARFDRGKDVNILKVLPYLTNLP